MKASRKKFMEKFNFLGQKGNFLPKHYGTITKTITLNLYIDINGLAYERQLTVKVWSRPTTFCFFKFSFYFYFTKTAIFSTKMSQ